MGEERLRLQRDLEQGVLSQENYDKCIQEMEETLTGIRNGTITAALLDNGGVFTATVPDTGALSTDYQSTRDGVSLTVQNTE